MILQKCTLIIFVAMVFRLNFFITKIILLQHGNSFYSKSFAIIGHVSLAWQKYDLILRLIAVCLRLKGAVAFILSFIEVLSSSANVRSVSAVRFLQKIHPSFSGATHCTPIIHSHIQILDDVCAWI